MEIVLVEDDPNDVTLMQHALTGDGLGEPLRVLRDGVEALEYLLRGAAEPRLVLLDLKLPRMDGIELLRRLKSDERTRSIPVVVLTSSREDVDLQRCYDLGANSYVVKPVDFEQFIKTMRDVRAYWSRVNQLPRAQ